MPISFSSLSGGSGSTSGDFVIDMNDSVNDTVELARLFPAGAYNYTTSSASSGFDLYFISEDGTSVAYSTSSPVVVTEQFDTVVALGLPSDEVITFTYSGPVSNADGEGDEPGAGAYISTIFTSDLFNADDSTAISGGNFANDLEVNFVSGDTSVAAKSVTVSDTQNAIVVRPDSINPQLQPYKLEVVNPGVQTPDASENNLSDSIINVAPAPDTVEYLVIAGGGSGGADVGGGGGAGGYRSSVNGESSGGGSSAESTFTPTSGTLYSITIGAGGARRTIQQNGQGLRGTDSVFASITSLGGGGGGGGDNQRNSGLSGGSGGGGGNWATYSQPGAGTSGQGFSGGENTNGSSSNEGGAGGGGAGAAGQNSPTSGNTAGAGGVGVSSSITGSATFRAGGGGGGGNSPFPNGGAGGNGGGGNGATYDNGGSIDSGDANTGGGGGGVPGNTQITNFSTQGGSGAGGSGIVILRYPTTKAQLSNIDVGLEYSLNVVGSNYIYEFTSGTGEVSW